MKRAGVAIAAVGAGLLLLAQPVSAAVQKSGSVGLQGTIPSPPPKTGATIGVPSNGAVFTQIPITVSGLCPSNLLVKIFSNGIFVGSTTCSNGSYSLKVDLFNGRNDLVARVYDALDQAGPDSNKVTVTFKDADFLRLGTHVSLSSAYAQRGAPPGQELDWPILLDGGTSPYAISVDWGDGTAPDLMSVDHTGTITIKHTYKVAGVYKVLVKASDKNGGEAFLQVVGQATGAIQSQNQGNKGSNVIIKKQLLWWPALEILPFILAAFWLGRRYQESVRLKQLEQAFEKEDKPLKKA